MTTPLGIVSIIHYVNVVMTLIDLHVCVQSFFHPRDKSHLAGGLRFFQSTVDQISVFKHLF